MTQSLALKAGEARVRLGARGITRRFGALTANDQIDFSARPGTIHAIVGGNGAGKSTLMRILQGMDQPDEGSIIVNDSAVALSGPAEAFRLGIGMVHQEFMLVNQLTMLENLILAREPVSSLGVIDRAAALKAGQDLAERAGVMLNWHQRVQDAPVHARQILEILRLLYRGADVLILDEPTAVLAPQQIRDLLVLLQRLRDDGRTILFISHKLGEVMAISDDITVIRTGRVITSGPADETSKAQLAVQMTGEMVRAVTPRRAREGDTVLSITGLGLTDGRGIRRLSGIDLSVAAGEIVALAGISGNGQDELVEAITGLSSISEGNVALRYHDVTGMSLHQRRALGLAYLSPDRAHEGLCLEASITDNVIAGHHRRAEFLASGLLRLKAIRAHAEAQLDRFGVRRDSAALPVSSLSGGNQQRVAIARELDGSPALLIACQPTRGVDIHGIAAIHQCLLEYRDAGGAVLLVSEELEEIMTLADRITVLFNGAVRGTLRRGEADVESIGRLMLGEDA
jgi:general nucleoside transport system ATP-binding protein